ncbi:hypothetical protein F4703DRAFT_1600597 [Phycomyces blakesleeanus]
MPASELPLEILLQIAELLLTNDRRSCALTCKGWRYPFQEFLWKHIHVDSMNNFETLFNTIEDSRIMSKSYGPLVRSLRLCGECIIPSIQQDHFLRSLPNLKHLDLGRMSYKLINPEMTRINDTWMSLESLRIKIPHSGIEETTEEIIEFLTNISKLQKIELIQCSWNNSIKYMLDDFDKIHQKLQQLSCMKASISLGNILHPAQLMIPNTIPALALTRLDLNLRDWDPLWLYYFGHKYPNLRFIKLDISHVRECKIPEEVMRRNSALFLYNPDAMQYLETFNLITKDISDSSHVALWDFICPLNIQIKHLKYTMKHKNGGGHFFKMIIKGALRTFADTLETLSVEGNVYFDSKYTSKIELSPYCPLLVDLRISNCGLSIDISNILDNCGSLRRLRLYNGELCISQDAANQKSKRQKDHQHHGLNILELHEVLTSDSVFKHISFRCRHLQYMNLDTLTIVESISKKTGNLLIDMSHTLFKVLRLDNIQYYSLYDDTDDQIAINLLLLSQLNNSLFPNKNKQKEFTGLKFTVVDHTNHIAWLHTFHNIAHKRNSETDIRRLSRQVSNTTLKHHQDSHTKKKPKVSKSTGLRNKYDSCESWQDYLLEEYVELRCGHVAKAILPGLPSKDKEFWDELYDRLFKNKSK